mgnify:CR=1 FL=1
MKEELDRLYAQGTREVARDGFPASRTRERCSRASRATQHVRGGTRSWRSRTRRRASSAFCSGWRRRSAAPGRCDASGGIRPWRGVLDWPARGALVETFGRHRHPRFDAWTFSNGISLALPAGTPVRAVYSGRAIYAQWLAEYGNLVILDHGDGVFTLYAWLQTGGVRRRIVRSRGERRRGDGMGPGRDEPGLYFEVRDHQKANDPVAWLR